MGKAQIDAVRNHHGGVGDHGGVGERWGASELNKDPKVGELTGGLKALGGLGHALATGWSSCVPGSTIHDITRTKRKCGVQDQTKSAEAARTYNVECHQFAQRHPHAARAYHALSSRFHDAEKIGAVAFLVGFNFGLAGTHLDPAQLMAKIVTADWPRLQAALHEFITSDAVKHGNATFEPKGAAMHVP